MFEQFSFLYLLILIPLFVIFFIWRGIVRASIMNRIGDKELIKALSSQVSPFRRQLKALLWLFALTMLIIALARPTWGIEREVIRTEGVQIVFAIDISRSMDANDVSPSRLDRARFETFDIMTRLAGNDIGIVLFAREAFTYMPLTYDLGAAEVFLNGISTTMVTQQGTNIPDAIERALGSFETRSDSQKIIVLVTDGESHEGDAIAAARLAAEENVIIYTIGYGTETGSNIPIYNVNGDLAGYQTTGNSGILINTVQNVSLLRDIASETGGFYIPSGIEMTPLVTDIQSRETGEIGEQVISRPIERFIIFVGFAVAALSFEILLPETKRDDDDVA